MRAYDLAPLYRSTIGFDRLFSLMDQVAGLETAAPTYPPYNIEKLSETDYRITLAVAGFAEADLTIETLDNSLVMRGEKKAAEKPATEVLFQGIAARQFERRFQLAETISVTGARLENGLLVIDLVRLIPEAKRPRIVRIGANGPALAVEQVAA